MARVVAEGTVSRQIMSKEPFRIACDGFVQEHAERLVASYKYDAREWVLTVESSAIAKAKERLMRVSGCAPADVERAEFELRELGLTRGQINHFVKTKKSSKYQRILCPVSAVVDDIISVRRRFEPHDIIFTYRPFGKKIIEVRMTPAAWEIIDRDHFASVRPTTQEKAKRSRAHIIPNLVRTFFDSKTLVISLDLGSHADLFEVDAPVEVVFKASGLTEDRDENVFLRELDAPTSSVTPTEDPDPEMAIARKNGWLYSSKPRGRTRVEYGLSSYEEIAPASALKAKKQKPVWQPFPTRGHTKPTPFGACTSRVSHPHPSDRLTIRMSPMRWDKARLAVVAARSENLTPSIDFRAKLQREPAPTQAVCLVAPFAGPAIVHQMQPGDLVSIGQQVAELDAFSLLALQERVLEAAERDDGAVDGLRRELGNAGLPMSYMRELLNTKRPIATVPVIATVAGLVEEVAANGSRELRQGETIVELRAANSWMLRGEVRARHFDQMPALVTVELNRPLLPSLAGEGGGLRLQGQYPLLEDTRVKGGSSVAFAIPVPVDCIAFAAHYIEPSSVAVRIEDPEPGRKGVLLQHDCIAHIGKSAEVLVHGSAGALTPRSVSTTAVDFNRPEWQGLVEVTSGLIAGEAVVRDLTEVMRDDSHIAATMLGFWDPGAHIW